VKVQLRRRLKTQYQRRLDSVVTEAANQPPDGKLSADTDELEKYSKLIEFTKTRWTPDSALAAAIALVCMATAALLWSTKVPETNISLTAETESLQGSLTQAWRVDAPFQSGFLHMERLSNVQAPNLGLNVNQSRGDTWLRLEGGTISLQSLQVSKGALLEMSSGKDEVSLYFSLQPISGTITIVGKGLLTAGASSGEVSLKRSYDLPVPEILEFAADDPRGVPSRLTVHHPGRWNFGEVPIGALSFTYEQGLGAGESKLTSGAKSGFIRFDDTSWPKFEISENELLAIHGTENAEVEMRSAEPLIHVTLNGQVKDIRVGHAGATKRLAPSYLEYLYERKALALFWGAVVFGWGVLWGVRKTIFR
jgi:hypothetical protein